MRKTGLHFFFFFGIVWMATGQIGGRSTYQFLNLVSEPRQAAMGGKELTFAAKNPTRALANPATISSEMRNRLAINFSSYVAGISYGTAAYAFKVSDSLPVFHAGVTYINYGDFDGFDAFGNETASFGGNETALSVGSAIRIKESDFYAGLNLKLISSRLADYTSFGGAFDGGLLYINQDKDFRAALAFRNLGLQFTTYADQRESLPFEINLGMSQTLKNVPILWSVTLENLQQWTIAFGNPNRDKEGIGGLSGTEDDPSAFNNALRHLIVGVEFFPKGNFNIRLGYNFRRGEELKIVDERSFAGLSGGIELKIKRVRLGFSYVRYNAAASPLILGLNIDLN